MGAPHKHSEVIKAWADGHEVQCFANGRWHDITGHSLEWFNNMEYRIKPGSKKIVRKWLWAVPDSLGRYEISNYFYAESLYDDAIKLEECYIDVEVDQ